MTDPPDTIVTFEVDENGKTHSVLVHRRVRFEVYNGCGATWPIDLTNATLTIGEPPEKP